MGQHLQQFAKSASQLLTRRKKPKEEHDKRRVGILPWTATGVGAGSLGLAYGLGSDKQWDTVRNSLNSIKQVGDSGVVPPNSTLLQHYAKSMAPPASLSLFGYPASKLIPNFRSLGWVMGDTPLAKSSPDAPDGIPERIADALGEDSGLAAFMRKGIGQPEAHIKDPTSHRAAQAHYESFAKGPIPGYSHMLRGYEGHRGISPDITSGIKKTHGEYFGPKFDKFVNDYTKRQSGNGAMLLSDEFNTDYMSAEDQGNLLDEWMKSLTPAEQAELRKVETDQMKNLGYDNYKPMVEGVGNLRDKLKAIGFTAGGAGLGGLAGSSLYRALTNDDDESWRGHAGSIAAGMGLGGAAGYFGGTEAGRKQVGDLVQAIKRLTKQGEKQAVIKKLPGGGCKLMTPAGPPVQAPAPSPGPAQGASMSGSAPVGSSALQQLQMKTGELASKRARSFYR